MRTFACAVAAAYLTSLAGGAALAAPAPTTTPAPATAPAPASTPAAAPAPAPTAAPAAAPAPSSTSRQIVVAFANQPQPLGTAAGSTGTRYTGGGYTVAQSAQREARRIASEYALREVVSWPIQVLSMHCVVFEIKSDRPAAEVLAALAHDPRVALAQPLQEFHTLTDAGTDAGTASDAASAAAATYNDPLYDLQANLTALGIARAHERTQGAGVHIALIDTAVDTSHPDLGGRIAPAHSFVAPQTAPSASLRHGTAVAGVIAAVPNNHIGIVGIAPLARLEVFAGCWQLAPSSDAAACNTFTLARALAAALASGASLVNLSLAGPADPLLDALVRAGLKRGITFVAAAAGSDAPFPTAIPGVITASGTESPQPAGAFTVPAQRVLTLRPGGEYDFESGSSIAAAEVTGVIALLMSASAVHLTPASISLLLGGDSRSARESSAVDVNAALARLEGGVVAARSAH